MIYVLGSINMDVVANVDRPPKRGETVLANKIFFNLGGKGANQAVACAKMKSKVKMIAKVGNDAFSSTLKSELKSFGVNVQNVISEPCVSGVALITVQGGDNSIIVGGEANMRLTNNDVDNALKTATANDVLVAQLEIPIEVVEYAFNLAKKKGMRTILNPAPARTLSSNLLKNVDLIVPNETEMEIITSIAPTDDVNLVLGIKKLYEQGVKSVVVTLGAKGSAVIQGTNVTYIKARKVKVVDTTCAGDTFIGTLAMEMEKGEDLVVSAQKATLASSITIQREGASKSIPTYDELMDLFSNYDVKELM